MADGSSTCCPSGVELEIARVIDTATATTSATASVAEIA